MSPQLERSFRKIRLLVLIALAVVAYLMIGGKAWNNIHSRTPEVKVIEPVPALPDEWLYVTTNSVLFFPVVQNECRPKYALGQVHKGTKVLVISRQGEWVEVERDDQTAEHTHGCIHESMLEKRDD